MSNNTGERLQWDAAESVAKTEGKTNTTRKTRAKTSLGFGMGWWTGGGQDRDRLTREWERTNEWRTILSKQGLLHPPNVDQTVAAVNRSAHKIMHHFTSPNNMYRHSLLNQTNPLTEWSEHTFMGALIFRCDATNNVVRVSLLFFSLSLCMNAPIHIGITLHLEQWVFGVHGIRRYSMLSHFFLWPPMRSLYLSLVCLLFYLRILMNAFNMFFVSFVCTFFHSHSSFNVHSFTFATMWAVFFSCRVVVLCLETFPSCTHNDVFLTIERKQITQKSQ